MEYRETLSPNNIGSKCPLLHKLDWEQNERGQLWDNEKPFELHETHECMKDGSRQVRKTRR